MDKEQASTNKENCELNNSARISVTEMHYLKLS